MMACNQRAYALITGLVFLTVLTMVGIFTLRNSALETMMSANHNKGAQAFEGAEITRTRVSQLIDAHVQARGWPRRLGGAIEDQRFADAIPAGLTLERNAGGSPRNWYSDVFQTSSSFKPLDLTRVDARYSQDIQAGLTLRGHAGVRTLRADLNAGSGSAMSSGYEGLGKGLAAGGGNLFFYVLAQGQDPGAQATRHTAAVYRYIVRN